MLVMHFRCQKGMIKSVKPRKLIEEKPWGLWDSYSLSHPFFSSQLGSLGIRGDGMMVVQWEKIMVIEWTFDGDLMGILLGIVMGI